MPHHPRGARLGRRRFAETLDDLIPPAVLNDAVAVVAELLGNAVQHADALPGGVIRLDWRVDPPVVLVRVTDGGSHQAPVPRAATPDAVDGRGLAIVAALALRWGVEPAGDGRCVWADLGPVRGDGAGRDSAPTESAATESAATESAATDGAAPGRGAPPGA